MLILSAIGLLASGMLAYDGWRSLVDAEHTLICAIDPAIDCGPAMGLWQARILGFPNSYLGIATFSVAVTWAAARLAGARARWFRWGLLAGSVAGQVLIFFLMYTTFSQLPALCPWCTVIWIIMWPLLWFQIVDAIENAAAPGLDGRAELGLDGRADAAGDLESADDLVADAAWLPTPVNPLARYRWFVLAGGYLLALAVGLVTMGPRLIRW